MEKLYRTKGGMAEDFNVVGVELTSEDLDALERDLQEGKLPHTEGFFFGRSAPEDKTWTIGFIALARDTIANGKHLYYTSW
jgi:hypothetical protein